jgi:putative membrane protein
MSAGGWALMLMGWALVLGLTIWAVCRIFPAQGRSDARTTLDARLASGDISPNDYQWIREELDGHAAGRGVGRSTTLRRDEPVD